MKPRILQLAKFSIDSRGGIEKVTSSIHTLLKNKFSIFTIYLDTKTSKRKNLLGSKINYSISSFYFSINYLKFAYKLIFKCEYIIGHMPNPLCVILLLVPYRYILFWHSDVIRKNLFLNFFYKPFEILLILFAKEIVYTSQEYRNNSYSKFFNRKYKIVPLSCNHKALPRNNFTNYKKLLSVGRLVNYKNYIFLLSVMKKLPNYSLTIVGDGPDDFKLRKFIIENNITNVSILNNISNFKLLEIYSSHDIFCLASNTRAEAFGIVLVEALAFGLPILVAKNIGSGMMDICQDKINGLFFENNVNDFLKKIEYIDINYQFLSRNAQKSYEENFTEEQFVHNISSAILQAK